MNKQQQEERETDIKEVFAFRKELNNETDRGCVLMAASYLEFKLEQLLSAKLVGTKKNIEELFNFNGPLGTFSSKIKICYSIGLISHETQSELDLIRRIRNKFGHDYAPLHLGSDKILIMVKRMKQHYYPNFERPKAVFMNSVIGVLGQLLRSRLLVEKFKEYKHDWLTEEQKEKLFFESLELAEKLMREDNKQSNERHCINGRSF